MNPVVLNSSDLQTFDSRTWNPCAETILFETPNNWDKLQQTDIRTAKVWRETTDDMLEVVLSKTDVKYVITGVTKDNENNKTYLVIQCISPALGI